MPGHVCKAGNRTSCIIIINAPIAVAGQFLIARWTCKYRILELMRLVQWSRYLWWNRDTCVPLKLPSSFYGLTNLLKVLHYHMVC